MSFLKYIFPERLVFLDKFSIYSYYCAQNCRRESFFTKVAAKPTSYLGMYPTLKTQMAI